MTRVSLGGPLKATANKKLTVCELRHIGPTRRPLRIKEVEPERVMDRFSIRTTVLIGITFLVAWIGMCTAVGVMGKATHPVNYECHFPKVNCAPVSNGLLPR